MNDLVKIERVEGKEAVNARALWSALEIGRDFTTWLKSRIEKYQFVAGSDFIMESRPPELGSGNRGASTEYFLTIGMAKELCMVENNEKGREVRRWFIQRESELSRVEAGMSPIEILARSAQMLLEQSKKIQEQDNRLSQIEARLTTSPTDFYAVSGYASLRGIQIDISKASILGRKASKLSRESDYPIGEASDPRFGRVNTYHLDILKTIFDQETTHGL